MLKKAVILLAIAIGLVLFLFPKNILEENNNMVRACNCIGFSTEATCYGIAYGCANIFREEEHTISGEDILLVLDKSQSMSKRLRQAKDAAITLVRNMRDHDQVSVMVFDINANVLHQFSNDKESLIESIEQITVSEETRYVPALRSTSQVFEKSMNAKKKIIFLSDGEPEGEVPSVIYEKVYEIAQKGLCIYTIGYGEEILEGSIAEDILKGMADISIEMAGCGKYYKSGVDSLDRVLSDIYDEAIGDLELNIIKPNKQVYFQREIEFELETNLESICSVQMNNLPTMLIFNKSFTMQASSGLNRIKAQCKSLVGDQVRIKDLEFFARIPWNIRSKLPMAKVDSLSENEVEFLLNDIIKEQKLQVTRRTAPHGRGTMVYLIIENTKPVTLRNVFVSQNIPSYVTSKISDISSNTVYEVIGTNPLEVQYHINKIAPDKIITISFYIDKAVPSSTLSDIKTSVKFDEVSQQDIDSVIAQQNKTRDIFAVKRSSDYKDGSTHGILKFTQNNAADNVKIYLNIPKCMAHRINEMHFKNTNYRIVAEDPIILWQLTESSDFDIEYQVDKKLEDDCERQISVITIGDVQDVQTVKQQRNMLVILFPLSILPLIIIIIINKKLMENVAASGNKRLVRIVMLLIIIGICVFFFIPKDRYNDDMLCECFGFASKSRCVGLTHTCIIPKNVIETTESAVTYCPTESCQQLRKYMNTDPFSRQASGVDLTLVLDRSKSMEDKIDQAKPALINLISTIEDQGRVSIIQFDERSDLVQQFTTNKQSVIGSINNMQLGTSTQYIPALTRAHLNYLDAGDRRNQWQVIFVSDGAPGDEGKPETIYKKVREMSEDEICISTIGFGQEITPGSEAETVLNRMAEISNEVTGCGVYYYSSREMETLTKILGQSYEESQIKRIGIDIDVSVDSLEMTELEYINLEAGLASLTNGEPVPGEYSIGKDKLCTPVAELQLVLEGVEKAGKFIYQDNNYVLSMPAPPKGNYLASVHAQLGDDCDISDSLKLGVFSVLDNEENTCNSDDCYSINHYLVSNQSKRKINVLITDYAFVPQNISITKGTTVIWKNIGNRPHTVTSGINSYDGLFHSGLMIPGESFNHTFETDQKVDYFDNMSKSLRAGMNLNRTRNYSIGNFSLEYKKNIDLSLLIDQSGSMAGKKIENVRTASKQLIHIVYPGDRVSVMRFSEEANIVNTFTDDKILLMNSIDTIHAGGNTLYVPAMEKANENYELYGSNTSGRIVIFLTDGEPWDDDAPISIFNTVQGLIDNGICIYAIGYGEEVYEGSKSEQILQKIVRMSQESDDCGGYKYSPSSQIRLSKIFGSIYHDAIGQMEGLVVDAKISKHVILDNESLDVRAMVRSSFNGNPLPGEIRELNVCSPSARVDAVLRKNGDEVDRVAMQYIGPSTGYTTSFSGLDTGSYELVVEAMSVQNTGEKCNYVGEDTASVLVLTSEEFSADPLFIVFAILLVSTAIYVLVHRE